MKLSVVIPNHNCVDTFLMCLDALNQQQELPDEVIIVDNNSTPENLKRIQDGLKMVSHLNLLLVHEKKIGAAAARNKGIAVSKGEIVAFVDADCIPDQFWVGNVKKAFEADPHLDVVGGVDHMFIPPATVTGKLLCAFWLPPANQLQRSIITKKEDLFDGKFIVTFNCAFKKTVLQKIHGFDESFHPAGEDMDIWMRALEANAKIMSWDPSIRVCHLQNISFKILIKKLFHYGEAMARLVKKHFSNRIVIQNFIFGNYQKPSRWGTIVFFNNMVKLSIFFLVFFALFFTYPRLSFYWVGLFFLYFLFKISRLVKGKGVKMSLLENVFALVFYICREISEEMGRVYGSFKYKIVCL